MGVDGFAKEPFTELVELTTVEQHSSEIGRSATRLLFVVIMNGQTNSRYREVIIKPEIIIRHSILKHKAYEIQ
jgi:DNA-binding LacI/PurR family transcriptional regulator